MAAAKKWTLSEWIQQLGFGTHRPVLVTVSIRLGAKNIPKRHCSKTFWSSFCLCVAGVECRSHIWNKRLRKILALVFGLVGMPHSPLQVRTARERLLARGKIRSWLVPLCDQAAFRLRIDQHNSLKKKNLTSKTLRFIVHKKVWCWAKLHATASEAQQLQSAFTLAVSFWFHYVSVSCEFMEEVKPPEVVEPILLVLGTPRHQWHQRVDIQRR